MTVSETHVLVDIGPGALLLDLQSGQLFHLNQSAALVWRHHLAGDSTEQITRALVSRYEIPEGTARRDADAALRLSSVAIPAPPTTEFHYQRAADGYVFSRLGQPLFLIDGQGQQLSRAPSADLQSDETRRFLSSVAPKLLSLRGHTVLHASAVALDNRLIVFSGASGAGKTTTARAMVKGGASSVCEDKLAVRLGEAGIDAVVGTESMVAAWVETAAAALAAGRPASCEALAVIARAPVLPMAEIGFLSANRRTADSLSARTLAPADAAAAIFSNSFYGSAEPEDWKRQLVISAAIARDVGAFEMTVPGGISGLTAAARDAAARGSLKTGASDSQAWTEPC